MKGQILLVTSCPNLYYKVSGWSCQEGIKMPGFEKFLVLLGSRGSYSQSRHITCLFYMDLLKKWADTKAHKLMILKSSPILGLMSILMVRRILTWLSQDSAFSTWLSSPRFFARGLP